MKSIRWFARLLLAFALAAAAGSCSTPTTVPPTAASPPTEAAFFNHVVDEGDTCVFIAFTYNVAIRAVIEANGLAADCSDLYLGQSLRIPKPTPGVPPAAGVSKLPLARAEELVRAHILASQPEMNPSASFPLVEITTDEAWEGLGAQVYKVRGEVLLNEAFVVRGGQVTPIGESFGGEGVHSLLVADLDSASPPELVYAYSFGSGVHQSSVGVYRVEPQGVRAYELADFRYTGALLLNPRGGAAVVSGKADGGGILSDWRELGTLAWREGRPVLVASN